MGQSGRMYRQLWRFGNTPKLQVWECEVQGQEQRQDKDTNGGRGLGSTAVTYNTATQGQALYEGEDEDDAHVLDLGREAPGRKRNGGYFYMKPAL